MTMDNMRKIIIISILVIVACTFIVVWFKFINVQTDEVTGISFEDGFIFAVTDVTNIPNSGDVIKGKVLKGTLNVNDKVKILGINDRVEKSTIQKLELKKKGYVTATEGDELGLILEGIKSLSKGQVITSIDEVKSSTTFEGKMHILTKSEKGIGSGLNTGDDIRAYINLIYANGTVELLDGVPKVDVGEDVNAKIILNTPMAIYRGENITIYNSMKQKVASFEIINIY